MSAAECNTAPTCPERHAPPSPRPAPYPGPGLGAVGAMKTVATVRDRAIRQLFKLSFQSDYCGANRLTRWSFEGGKWRPLMRLWVDEDGACWGLDYVARRAVRRCHVGAVQKLVAAQRVALAQRCAEVDHG